MYYLGIDIGKQKHVAAMLTEEGDVRLKPLSFSATATGYQKLLSCVKSTTVEHTDIAIAMEATGHYWLPLYEKLKADGFSVTVLNPLQVSSFRNQGIRGSKTDSVDAVLIARVLRFGASLETRIPENAILALRNLTRYRTDLVQEASMAKNKVLALLDQVFPEFSSLFSDTFGAAALSLLKEAATPEEILKIDDKKLCSILKQASRGRAGKEQSIKIKSAAKSSFGLQAASDTFSLQIKLIISQVEHIKSIIKTLDEEIERLYTKFNTTLTTIPGVGTTTAATVLAEIEDVHRFKSPSGGAAALVAFAGLDPKLKESGKYRGQVKTSKRGSPYLRRALFLAGFIAVRNDDYFRRIYEKQRQKGKNHKVAMIHVSVKMLHVIYSMLKNNSTYSTNKKRD